MKRKSFVLYSDQYGYISDMTDSQLGKLFRMVFDYHINGEVAPMDDPVVAISFKFFKTRFDIDNEKYDDVCKRNRENGKKHTGQPSRTQSHPVEPSGLSRTQRTQTNLDNDNDNDNDNERIKDSYPISAISDEPILSAKTSFAPGCGNDVCFDVFNLYNRIIGRRKLEPKNLTAKRRDAISFQYRQLGCDISRFEKVFKGIAKAKDPNINNPYFDSIFDNKIYAPYWMNADK